MVSGAWPVRRRERSSRKTTSGTRRSGSSMPRCARAARAKVAASGRAEPRWRRRARPTSPPRSVVAPTVPIMARPGKAGSPGWRRSGSSQPTSWHTPWRRTSIRPWSPSVVAQVATAPGGGSAPRSRSAGRRTGSEGFDLLEGGRPVRLERQEVVAAARQDGRGDRAPGPGRVDRDQGAVEGEAPQEERDGGGLVRLAAHRPPPEHQPLAGRPDGDEVRRLAALAAVARA